MNRFCVVTGFDFKEATLEKMKRIKEPKMNMAESTRL